MSDATNSPPPIDNDSAAHIRPGLALPAVKLRATDGTDICLADQSGRILLFVYPWTGRPGEPNPPNWDDIPGAHGSTPEIEGFRDLAPEFAKAELAVFGLSNQPLDYQREMVVRLRVPFLILSDAEGNWAAALALPSFETGGVKYLKRLSLIARDGVVETVFDPVADPASHASDVLRWIKGSRAAS